MKSFSQFLNESYIEEEEAKQLRLFKRDDKSTYNFRKNVGNMGVSADPTPLPASRRLSSAASEVPKPPSGQLEIPEPKTTKVSKPQFRNAGEARQGSLLTKSGGVQNFTRGRTPFVSTEPVKATKRLSANASEAPKVSPGQMEIDFNANPNKGGALVKTSSNTPATKSGKLATRSSTKPAKVAPIKTVDVRDITPKQKVLPSGTPTTRKTAATPAKVAPIKTVDVRDITPKQKVLPLGTPGGSPTTRKTAATPAKVAPIKTVDVRDITPKQKALPAAGQTGGSKGKPPTGVKPTGKFAKVGRLLGPASAALDTVTSTADERAKGSGWARSLAKGATVAAGGLAGGALGALGGGGLGSAALGTAGAIGGAELAGRAFDTAAGANAKERAAMAKANRQRQAGTAIKGIGGQTTFSQKKPGGPAFMSTGSGSQRKTVQLAKTGVVQRGSQSTAGHLAFKGGQAVYKAGPSAQSLAKTSSNPLERIGRSLFAGAYKKHDTAKAQQALAKARQSDAARQKALGVKALPGK
jgi:hypothetical protein